LGRIDYTEACELQRKLVAARKAGVAPDLLLVCEHPHVLTIGRNGRIENLRVSQSTIEYMGVQLHHTNRGGDVTYHGPGQIVGYPILQLGEIRRDVVWYVRQLEELMIRTSATFGVDAFPVPGRTGVWSVGGQFDRARKLGTGGPHCRWVTSHGFA
jgi:lipoyl(octanoyl) transferase